MRAPGCDPIASHEWTCITPLVNAAVAAAGKTDLLTDWVIAQGQRVMGVTSPAEVFQVWRVFGDTAIARYVLRQK